MSIVELPTTSAEEAGLGIVEITANSAYLADPSDEEEQQEQEEEGEEEEGEEEEGEEEEGEEEEQEEGE